MNDRYPGPADLPYLSSWFVVLEDLARDHGHDAGKVRQAVADGLLPAVPYELQDGTQLVAPDYFQLADLAGRFEALPAWFASAYEQAAARYPRAGTAGQQWQEYLTGLYAVCLRSVSPASIVAKGELIDTIQALISEPHPDSGRWRHELRTAVDALDALLKPFAQFDRARYGPTSRDRYITAVRERFDLSQPPQPRSAPSDHAAPPSSLRGG